MNVEANHYEGLFGGRKSLLDDFYALAQSSIVDKCNHMLLIIDTGRRLEKDRNDFIDEFAGV